MSKENWYDSTTWESVPMWKAMTLWAEEGKSIRCQVKRSQYYFKGGETIHKLDQDFVKEGQWFVEG
ncbi:hypothetical protein [Bacillus thuringiensis]|uniref:hypothetical protein n=1 Tax=Bacillus thuringiensis TaxID=1428 RepID=UPI002DB6560C|nr:hypothetical protein [Bacillus thuringiensis]MEC3458548.1 hypothetical protein [Bacillus thuringiensis]